MRSIGNFSIFIKFSYHSFDLINCLNMSKMALEAQYIYKDIKLIDTK